MAIRFIDLEKAYATIPREMTMGTLMWIEVPGRSNWWRGHEDQGAVWTGSVRRVQSKCWSDTGERLEPIVVYRCCGIDQQKDLYKSLWNSKLVALKRESLLNTFADGGLNVVDIRTKI